MKLPNLRSSHGLVRCKAAALHVCVVPRYLTVLMGHVDNAAAIFKAPTWDMETAEHIADAVSSLPAHTLDNPCVEGVAQGQGCAQEAHAILPVRVPLLVVFLLSLLLLSPQPPGTGAGVHVVGGCDASHVAALHRRGASDVPKRPVRVRRLPRCAGSYNHGRCCLRMAHLHGC